jgi:hypothetical protein
VAVPTEDRTPLRIGVERIRERNGDRGEGDTRGSSAAGASVSACCPSSSITSFEKLPSDAFPTRWLAERLSRLGGRGPIVSAALSAAAFSLSKALRSGWILRAIRC